MARPEKPDDDKRELVIRLRVTSSEKSRIWQNASNAGRTPSDYLRGLAVNAKPSRNVPTTDRGVLLKLLAELGKHGSNLNQIARAINRRPETGELIGIDWTHLNNTLQAVEELKTQLIEILTA